jgi:HAD superfamily hydrolase (TIGR01509 family)
MKVNTQTINTVLFDWDGTIVDSHELGLSAFEHSFASLGIAFDHQKYQEVYSPNWYSVYEAMGLPRNKWDAADQLWIQHYGEQTPHPVPGAKETISALHQSGYVLGVVSSGSDCRVSREVSELGMTDLFDIVICNERMQNKKPHPEGLETALRELNRGQDEACYVGDSPEDIEMGKRASLLTVGIRSGYPTSWKLQDSGPDIYLTSLKDLPQHFPPR